MPDAIDMTLLATLQAQCAAANATIAAIPPVTPPTGYTTTINNIERLAGWLQPGNVGNTGGGSPVPHGTYELSLGSTVTPAMAVIQPAYPYDNYYFYRTLGQFNAATQFQLAMEFMLPTAADLAASQAIEMELQQANGAFIFNMALQFTLAGPRTLKIFNYATKVWEDTGIAFTLLPGNWMAVAAQFARTATAMTHVGVYLNGTHYPIGKTHAGTSSGSSYLNAAFQMDSTGGTPPPSYKLQIQNYNVSWT